MIREAKPSPDKFRDDYMSLNGPWDFSFDEPTFDRTINVPFSWTCPLSGINEPTKKGTAYYRRNVLYNPLGSRVFLIFTAVDYECEISINGTVIKKHLGGYGAFEAEATEVWNDEEENTVIVSVTDNEEDYQMFGKQGYGGASGIWQGVYLEKRPKSFIKSFVTRTKINGEIKIKAKIEGEYSGFFVEIGNDKYSSNTDEICFKIDNPKLWEVDSPKLYDARLILDNNGEKDIVKTYFGIREIGTAEYNKKMYITLNNKPIFINGVLDQSFHPKGFFTFPTNEYAREEIERIKATGLNTARIHIKCEDPLKLYWADKLGLLIIEDFPCFWGEPTEKARKLFSEQMYEIAERDINHPSVFYWVIFNETWGLKTFTNPEHTKWEFDKSTAQWVEKLYYDLKEYDPTRLVEDNSPCNKDHLITDVNSWHFYRNGYKNIKDEFEHVSQSFTVGSEENYICNKKMTNVPIMNSECGNYWGLDGNAGDSDISYQYKYMINELRLHERICGFVFTELKDVTNEFNGFYRIDDTKKYFGYEYFNPHMSVLDLHSPCFVGFDFPPIWQGIANEKISVPVFLSQFSEISPNLIKWELLFTDGFGKMEKICDGELEVNEISVGTTMLPPVEITLPNNDGLTILNVYLMDDSDKIIMSNYTLFETKGNKEKGIPISLDKIIATGFEKKMMVQNGNKLNCIGDGELTFSIDTKMLSPKSQAYSLVFEASSKEPLTKDLKESIKSGIDLDFMRGYTVDRGANPNSFYMTDDEKYVSKIEIYVNDVLMGKYDLPDDPADSRGWLSHLYQPCDNLLDEAGSYGYLIKCPVSSTSSLKGDSLTVKIKVFGGISVFSRKSGCYPIDVTFRCRD